MMSVKTKSRGLSEAGGELVDVSGQYQRQQMSISTSIIQCAMIMVMATQPCRRVIISIATLIFPTRFSHDERRNIYTSTIAQTRITGTVEQTAIRKLLQVPVDPGPSNERG